MNHPGIAILLTSLAGWMNPQQLDVIDYLREENRTLKQLVGSRRLRLNDMQRRGLVRYHVLFVIDLATRRVRIAGLSPNPTGAWMEQVARAPADPLDGFLRSMGS